MWKKLRFVARSKKNVDYENVYIERIKNILASDLNREMRFLSMPITLPSARTLACRKLEHFEKFRRDLLNFSPETTPANIRRYTFSYYLFGEGSVRCFRVRLHIALIDFEHSHECDTIKRHETITLCILYVYIMVCIPFFILFNSPFDDSTRNYTILMRIPRCVFFSSASSDVILELF